MIFLSRPRSSLVADLSLRPRREEVAKEAGKLLPNYLVSEMPADKRGHCFRDPVRIPVSQRNDKMSQLRPGSHQTCLVSTERNTKPGNTCPDSGYRAPGPTRRGKLYRKALGNATDFVARSASQFVLFLGLAAANVGEISNRSLDCRLPACLSTGREGGRGRGRHTCAK